MTTFLTAIIWGLGVSLGGSIGCMAFVLLFGLYKDRTGQRAKEINEASVAALQRRNELTVQQVAQLERIADVMESQAID